MRHPFLIFGQKKQVLLVTTDLRGIWSECVRAIRKGFHLMRVITDPKQFIGSGARGPAQGRHHVITRTPTEPHANRYLAGGTRLTDPTLSLGGLSELRLMGMHMGVGEAGMAGSRGGGNGKAGTARRGRQGGEDGTMARRVEAGTARRERQGGNGKAGKTGRWQGVWRRERRGGNGKAGKTGTARRVDQSINWLLGACGRGVGQREGEGENDILPTEHVSLIQPYPSEV